MGTAPRHDADEAPLDAQVIDKLLSNFEPDMVLVGGQALGYWMDRFDIPLDGAEIITSDGDALGEASGARKLAQALQATLLEPKKTSRTAIVAQLRIPTREGEVANVDVLHLLYTLGGLKKSSEFTRRVIKDSVQVEWREGKFIRVMDPFDVLDSRVQNAVGLLDEKGPHVITQAIWAVAVAKAALLKLAAREQIADGRVGRKIQAIYTLAHSQGGRRLLSEHGIEVLEAIDLPKLARHSQLAPQLRKVQAALFKRRG